MARNPFTITRKFYLPEDAEKIDPPLNAPAGTEIYYYERTYNGGNTRYIATCFTGRAQKPAKDVTYLTAEARHRAVQSWLTALVKDAEWKAEQRKIRTSGQVPWKPGTILCGTWGYEQTNVEFFMVVKVLGKRKIMIRELPHEIVPGSHGYMCCSVMPGKPSDNPTAEYLPRVAQRFSRGPEKDGWYVNLHEHCILTEWTGQPRHKSWYN